MPERRKGQRRKEASATPPGGIERRAVADRRTADRRAGVRVPISLWVEETRGRGDVYFHQATNLSLGGCFLEKKLPQPAGTIVNLDLDVGKDEKVRVRGEIVAVVADASESGMAVRFFALDKATREALEHYIDQESKTSKGDQV